MEAGVAQEIPEFIKESPRSVARRSSEALGRVGIHSPKRGDRLPRRAVGADITPSCTNLRMKPGNAQKVSIGWPEWVPVIPFQNGMPEKFEGRAYFLWAALAGALAERIGVVGPHELALGEGEEGSGRGDGLSADRAASSEPGGRPLEDHVAGAGALDEGDMTNLAELEVVRGPLDQPVFPIPAHLGG